MLIPLVLVLSSIQVTKCQLLCDDTAVHLIGLINTYRQEHGKPTVPASPSLCLVAQTHADDFDSNIDPYSDDNCNMHSWSCQGDWSCGCYPSDHTNSQMMWDKPRELTDYPGNGFEISYRGGSTAEAAMLGWEGSPPHKDVMLNEGIWVDFPFSAVGAGFNSGTNYWCVWFGVEEDPAAEACVPDCAGKTCGGDGCNGNCGTCADDEVCSVNVCETGCVPDCAGKTCAGDGCGGTCGTCADDEVCNVNVCEPDCVPDCTGKTCGGNGCDGNCGMCQDDDVCNVNVCETTDGGDGEDDGQDGEDGSGGGPDDEGNGDEDDGQDEDPCDPDDECSDLYTFCKQDDPGCKDILDLCPITSDFAEKDAIKCYKKKKEEGDDVLADLNKDSVDKFETLAQCFADCLEIDIELIGDDIGSATTISRNVFILAAFSSFVVLLS